MIFPINIIAIGGCSIIDILKTDPNFREFYNVIEYRGSISRTFEPAGPIASRLYDTYFNKEIKKITIKQQFEAIYKKNTPVNLLKTTTKNYVVIVDLSYEFLSFYYDGREYFDIFPDYDTNKSVYPEWLVASIDKHRFWFDSGIQELAVQQIKNLRQFNRFVSSLKVPGILFGNIFTNRTYNKLTNSTVELLPLANNWSPFKNKLNTVDQTQLYDYNSKIVNSFYDKLLNDASSEFKIFQPDKELLYADPDHPNGFSPAHLHYTCRKNLLPKLKDMIFNLALTHQHNTII